MNAPAYGGDEISAIVLDPGAYTTRIGYAGEDAPKANIPTFCGYYTGKQQKFKHGYYLVGDTEINTLHADMDITNPFQDGLIIDWEANISIWQYAFEERLRTNTSEHPLLVTEPAWNTQQNREKTLEVCFEKFNVPAFYMAKQPVLASYAIGKHTALVVDLGAQMASVVPVSEGLVLKKGIFKQPLAGDFISLLLKTQFQTPEPPGSYAPNPINPHYIIKQRGTSSLPDTPTNPILKDMTQLKVTDSWHAYQQERILHNMKEEYCSVLDAHTDIHYARPNKSFEFPDGSSTVHTFPRYKAATTLFSPDPPTLNIPPAFSLPDMIRSSLAACDPDIRPALMNNIVVTGGTSLMHGMITRIEQEMQRDTASKIRIHAAGNGMERICGKWIGGSILASLGSFHQLWITKQEYEEVGRDWNLLQKRCP